MPSLGHNDRHITGFYTTKNSRMLNLRIQESNHCIDGIVRLNKTNKDEYVFEGYNGKRWVKFNAQQGEKGDTGDNFSKYFKFENTTNIKHNSDINSDNYGYIFKTLELETNKNNSISSDEKTIINIRTINSGKYVINDREYTSMDIKTIDNEIILKPNPQPFKWNFSNTRLSEYKSDINDDKFKAYGKTSIWKVKADITIQKGQAVRLDYKLEDDNLVILPINYSPNVSLNLFNNPKQFLGIALEDSQGKDSIEICTYGITTIKCNIDETCISSEFMNNNNITEIGLCGLVSSCGLIFNSPIKPLNDFIKAGYFLETSEISEEHQYLLFFVEK